MPDDRAKLLEKMRALANRANPEFNNFKEEMETAARMLQGMMEKYQVSWAEILQEQDGQAGFEAIRCQGVIGRVQPWHWSLARAIGTMTQTKHFIQGAYGPTEWAKKQGVQESRKGHRFMFFGGKEAAETAALLFDKWQDLIREMGSRARKEYTAELTEELQEDMLDEGVTQVQHLTFLGSRHPKIWQNSWLMGVATGVLTVVREREEERARAKDKSSQNIQHAIVLVTDAVSLAYVDYSKQVKMKSIDTSGSSRVNWGAYDKGVKVGKELNLHQKELSPGAKTLKGGAR